MAGEVLTSSSPSESDGNSILSGSVRYSTDLSEDSEAISEPEEVDEPRDEVLPYLFEPERRSRTYNESDDETAVVSGDSGKERIGNTNWCTFYHCQPMPTARESVCCQEIDEIKGLLVGDPVPVCITQHMDFANACLCRVVLLIASHGHRHHYGTSDIPAEENRKFRFLAYRQLVWWGWGYLGRHRRVVLPSCAVSRIRSEFPSDDYTGHQIPPPTL
ncbi:uncharacterized protein [Dysidea avara]|uniref:uncharacterized protein n=1 Tax=Dysidea avara TaxID=196820 RepID=UPI0033215E3E